MDDIQTSQSGCNVGVVAEHPHDSRREVDAAVRLDVDSGGLQQQSDFLGCSLSLLDHALIFFPLSCRQVFLLIQ